MKFRGFRRKKTPEPVDPRSVRKEDPRRIAYGGGWGMHVHWSNGAPTSGDSEGRVYGHLPRRPEVGDVLIVPMQSGRNSEWIFTTVDRPGDPPDMFFADVIFNGYTEEGPSNGGSPGGLLLL